MKKKKEKHEKIKVKKKKKEELNSACCWGGITQKSFNKWTTLWPEEVMAVWHP